VQQEKADKTCRIRGKGRANGGKETKQENGQANKEIRESLKVIFSFPKHTTEHRNNLGIQPIHRCFDEDVIRPFTLDFNGDES